MASWLKAISDGISNYSRTYNVTGGQWFMFFAALFAVYLSWGDDGFNPVAFIIVVGFFWLISAPFRAAGWMKRKISRHPCPNCGNPVPNGETQCTVCGYAPELR
jgi:hypothetical protein